MAFLTEPEPPRGVALDVLPGIRRVVARNPSVMTYHGTNTYLLDHDDGLTVIDPGPDNAEHVADIVRMAGDTPIVRLVITHAHSDHHGATLALQKATGAPSWGYHTSGSAGFTADHKLDDGDTVAGLQAVFTPGHAPDHLSFAYNVPGTGQILFSGDHVMTWSSSIVNPPHGDMLHYYRALELLLPRPDLLYLPGHGPVGPDPKAIVLALLHHRQMREATILDALSAGPKTVRALAAQLYAKKDKNLQIAAERNVLAHLLKMREEQRVVEAKAADKPHDFAAEISQAIDQEGEEGGAVMSVYRQVVAQDAKRQFAKRDNAIF